MIAIHRPENTLRLLHLAALLQILQQTPSPLADVLHAGRVKDDQYRLIMFNSKDDSASGFTLVKRSVERTEYQGRRAIRVREENRAAGSTVSISLDATSLRPLSYEARWSDTLSVTARTDGDSMRITENKRGVTSNAVSAIERGAYFSNSFSELVQSNDFGAHPRISFATFTPGAPANRFVVERIGRRTVEHGVAVWVLKFTRTDASGASATAGYRYVDVQTGKVLFFATELDSPTAFTYQVLPLK